MKSETCHWNQRHLMPLISEVVKWRGRVSLISEVVIRGNCVSDFRGIEGEGRWGRASLIWDSEEGWECPVHHARMHHAPVQHALWTMDSCHCIVPPCTCTMPFATCPMHHHASCPVHHAPLSLHHAILHVQTCCYRLSTVQLSYSTHPIAWWMGSITINRYVICTT